MSRAYSIISGFLQNSDASFFHFRIGAGTEQTVVMMNAGSANHNPFSVDGNAFFSIPAQSTDSKTVFIGIFAEFYTGSVQLRSFRFPERCCRKFQFKGRLTFYGAQNGITVAS